MGGSHNMRRFIQVATLLALLVLYKRPAEATINFPATLDDNSTLFSLVNGDAYIAQFHNNPKDAVLALEAKVGVDGSAVTSSLDYILRNSASVNPGHTHTGTSIAFSDGSAASPGLRFGNPVTDTNTGLFHPGAGSIAIASGGAEIVRVTATGVGIFVASPNFPLDIAGTLRLQSASTLCFGGTGAADNDTCVSRSAAHVFKHVGSGRFDDVATTDDTVQINGIAAKTGSYLLVKALSGDANGILQIDSAGKLFFGAGGGSAVDTNIYRGAADQLKTDDNLVVAGTGASTIGGAAATVTLGGASSTVNIANAVLSVLDAATNTITVEDATNFVLGTGTGLKIGTATSQKIGFFNATPVIQPAATDDLKDALQALGLYASANSASPLNLNGGAFTTTGTATVSGIVSPHGNLALANGANTNVTLTADTTVFRLTGPSGAFSINGFTGGTSGRIIILLSTVSQTLTVTNLATSTAANQIDTMTGADIVCTATEKTAITMVYEATAQKWFVTSVMNCATV